MTTILADYRFGLMVSDSHTTDGDRAWSERKVRRVRGALIGLAGLWADFEPVLDWYRGGMAEPMQIDNVETAVLVLKGDGLFLLDASSTRLQRVSGGREAVGTGGKAAIAAYEAMYFTDPRRAVQIACRHDPGSRPPVRLYRL